MFTGFAYTIALFLALTITTEGTAMSHFGKRTSKAYIEYRQTMLDIGIKPSALLSGNAQAVANSKVPGKIKSIDPTTYKPQSVPVKAVVERQVDDHINSWAANKTAALAKPKELAQDIRKATRKTTRGSLAEDFAPWGRGPGNNVSAVHCGVNAAEDTMFRKMEQNEHQRAMAKRMQRIEHYNALVKSTSAGASSKVTTSDGEVINVRPNDPCSKMQAHKYLDSLGISDRNVVKVEVFYAKTHMLVKALFQSADETTSAIENMRRKYGV